ncbi:MAG: hypothetical protein AAGA39_07925, partial [Pseudomonadota bacterium]
QSEARVDVNLAAVDFDRPKVGHTSIFAGNGKELKKAAPERQGPWRRDSASGALCCQSKVLLGVMWSLNQCCVKLVPSNR